MGDLDATSLLYSARPALTLDGAEQPELAEGLLALSVEETTEGLSSCEATFGNWGTLGAEVGFLYFDRRTFDFGRDFQVDLGADDNAATVFVGRISAIEGRFPQERPPEVLVLAEDRLQDLRMVRRSRTFEDVTDSDVFEQVASAHGLRTEIDVDGPNYPVLAQLNQSDLAFLRERARAVDAELWVENTTLHVQARSRRRGEDVTLTYGQGLKEFSVSADLSDQRTSLTVSGWDRAAKEAIEGEATESSVQGELNGSDGGGSVLEQSFGERSERIVHMAPLSSREAQVLADAGYRRIARRFLRGHAVAEGSGRLRVGSHVNFRGLGDLFDGEYYVTETKHLFDASGYRTHFTVERPWIGGS